MTAKWKMTSLQAGNFIGEQYLLQKQDLMLSSVAMSKSLQLYRQLSLDQINNLFWTVAFIPDCDHYTEI